MYTAFVLIATLGLAYVSVSIIVSHNPSRFKNKFRQQLNAEKLSQRFYSEKMQKVLSEAGLNLSSKKLNIYRFVAIIGVLIVTYGSMFLKDQSLKAWPLLICLIIFICSSSAPFTPSGWILRKLYQRNTIHKDGELIAFLKLYENNRMKESGYVQLDSFCVQMAPHFRLIGKDLMQLSERIIEDGLETGLDWFVSKFPRDHPFINEIRTILLTVENMDDYEIVAKHLKSQSAIISKISSDQYERRWKFIGDIATIFTSIPSILIFVMIIALVLIYVTIVKDNITNLNLL